jgi:hypothetical protein
MNSFALKLNVLPPAQSRLWPELRQVPGDFVLYGGTAVALWLGHRASADFDFFSTEPFAPSELHAKLPFLAQSTRLQSMPNTLTVGLDRGGPVKISFFGGLHLGRVGNPERALDNGLALASKLDLAATKARVITERAERKDYLDMAALLESGITLAAALGAARALYGEQFNPMITLKALNYFGDGDLPQLPDSVKQFLSSEAAQVKTIPEIRRLSDRIAT